MPCYLILLKKIMMTSGYVDFFSYLSVRYRQSIDCQAQVDQVGAKEIICQGELSLYIQKEG